ncbi:S-ribosylhomocysteine lyase /quorum-sensing autoinducer 2 (AI-2) synthesis protein LuxS [Caloranaerobacter azorensis DSM 13643]|uniref:S-ribosylhomocysteine lyase n=1 Tax=Caloranaerobacter azorensis DSM 13643 TaxID=1121264 RepID=A0A1M5VCE5_9FIRM|nr:S-ribosylhomocysteine lyase [Caloranaerobacter azorensis]SHH72876.1 S-ribosylhomocysteine lyase /quorum-sensing autoinducer 2 (AI-2) synthesis protein LuxS [Caloranaerobacter azorensis DSM 13643]
MENIIVESFTLDHTKVKAPYVRKCGVITTPKGDSISKFDLRFTQPNVEAIPTGAIHAIEHLLAGFIREELDNVVDISPMGCRTGFYLIIVGEINENEVAHALIKSLEKILLAKEIPAVNPVQCGNYRDMSLFGAKEYSKKVLKGLKEKYEKEE